MADLIPAMERALVEYSAGRVVRRCAPCSKWTSGLLRRDALYSMTAGGRREAGYGVSQQSRARPAVASRDDRASRSRHRRHCRHRRRPKHHRSEDAVSAISVLYLARPDARCWASPAAACRRGVISRDSHALDVDDVRLSPNAARREAFVREMAAEPACYPRSEATRARRSRRRSHRPRHGIDDAGRRRGCRRWRASPRRRDAAGSARMPTALIVRTRVRGLIRVPQEAGELCCQGRRDRRAPHRQRVGEVAGRRRRRSPHG